VSFRLSLIVALTVSLAACDSAEVEPAQPASEASQGASSGPPPLSGKIVRFKAGTEMPALTFKDPTGATLNTEDLRGTPVLLNLWATWCAPCVVEMPLLDQLAVEMGDEIKVLTVSQDMRGADVVVPFFEDRDFKRLEQWLDEDANLAAELNQEGVMPLTVLFDAEGKELFRVSGDYHWASDDAIAAIREAIAR